MLSKLLLPVFKQAQKEPTKVACIGTRKLPPEGEEFCVKLGIYLVGHNCFVGSGNAEGADQAYLRGVNRVAPWKGILYLPWKDFNSSEIAVGNHIRCEPYPEEYLGLVRSVHAKPDALNARPLKLMIRNCAILERAALCIAWPGTTGGTKFGMALAKHHNIPLIDLSSSERREELEEMMKTWP